VKEKRWCLWRGVGIFEVLLLMMPFFFSLWFGFDLISGGREHFFWWQSEVGTRHELHPKKQKIEEDNLTPQVLPVS
jgi:hypothetical protein